MSGIEIKKISITELAVDAIVNAANDGLRAGGGVCGAIFAAAGRKELQEACDAIGGCDTGSAAITPGFQLKARFIIHAVGPVWHGGNQGEADYLRGAYRRSLELAADNGCKSIAFPLISSGIFGYPMEEAWQVALQTCREYLKEGHEMDIIFAVLSDGVQEVGQKTLDALG